MSAPVGNQNAAKGKRWRDAIERALIRASGGENPYGAVEPAPGMKAIDDLADIFVAQCKAGDLGFFKEFGDRFDGKAPQQIHLGGDPDGIPVAHRIEQVIVDANDSTSR